MGQGILLSLRLASNYLFPAIAQYVRMDSTGIRQTLLMSGLSKNPFGQKKCILDISLLFSSSSTLHTCTQSLPIPREVNLNSLIDSVDPDVNETPIHSVINCMNRL